MLANVSGSLFPDLDETENSGKAIAPGKAASLFNGIPEEGLGDPKDDDKKDKDDKKYKKDEIRTNGDTIEGCLVRLSKVTLLNVTAGGGSVVPAFVVDPKA